MPIVPLPPGRAGLRWGIYCRISGKQGTKTGDDDDETVSLDTQEERCRALIAALDPTGTPVESLVLRDVWTGVELFTRPKLMQVLLPAIRRGEIDAIACFHPWRWTREPNHAGYLYIELDHNRVLLRFAEEDPGDDEKGSSSVTSSTGPVSRTTGREPSRPTGREPNLSISATPGSAANRRTGCSGSTRPSSTRMAASSKSALAGSRTPPKAR